MIIAVILKTITIFTLPLTRMSIMIAIFVVIILANNINNDDKESI